MKSKALVVVLALAVSLAGCIYTHVSMPLSTELDKTELGTKQGEASMYSVLWLVAWGDAGSAAAAKNGGITVLRHMDREFEAVLFGVYTRLTTVVYGD